MTVSPPSSVLATWVSSGFQLPSPKGTRATPGIPTAPVLSPSPASNATKPATNARPIVRAPRLMPTERIKRPAKRRYTYAGTYPRDGISLTVFPGKESVTSPAGTPEDQQLQHAAATGPSAASAPQKVSYRPVDNGEKRLFPNAPRSCSCMLRL